MDLLQVLILLTIAGICSALAEIIAGVIAQLTGFRIFFTGSIVVTIVIGIIGSYIGTWLSGRLGVGLYSVIIGPVRLDLIWSVLGSLLVLTILTAVRGRPTSRTIR